MQIGSETVVTVDYKLTDEAGNVIDSSEGQEPLAYLHGVGQIVPGLERALTGKATGDRLQVQVAPEDGYGTHDPERMFSVPRTQFPGIEDIAVGMEFQGDGPDGAMVVRVVGIEGDQIALDGNHPLAGMTLHFDVTIVEVRAATTEELAHGHPHGAGDHHH